MNFINECFPSKFSSKVRLYECSVSMGAQPNHTVTPTHIEPEQYNTRNKSTISRKILKMDVLTFEICWAVNSEIINLVTSSWSIFIQWPLYFDVFKTYYFIQYFLQALCLCDVQVSLLYRHRRSDDIVRLTHSRISPLDAIVKPASPPGHFYLRRKSLRYEEEGGWAHS